MARLKSGHQAPRVYHELARRLVADLLEARPELANYPESVAAWGEAEAQAALLRRYLAELGPVDYETGKPREPLLRQFSALENLAAKRRAELGLDPRSEAKLAKERAAATGLVADLGALVEQGRAALADGQGLAHDDLAGQVLEQVKAEAAAERAEQVREWRLAHGRTDLLDDDGQPLKFYAAKDGQPQRVEWEGRIIPLAELDALRAARAAEAETAATTEKETTP